MLHVLIPTSSSEHSLRVGSWGKGPPTRRPPSRRASSRETPPTPPPPPPGAPFPPPPPPLPPRDAPLVDSEGLRTEESGALKGGKGNLDTYKRPGKREIRRREGRPPFSPPSPSRP